MLHIKFNNSITNWYGVLLHNLPHTTELNGNKNIIYCLSNVFLSKRLKFQHLISQFAKFLKKIEQIIKVRVFN